MSPVRDDGGEARYRFPRVSGDEPFYAHPYTARGLFSPRERG